jgi:hypothetical protein
MLYDPDEFWEQVRAAIREEIAQSRTQTTMLHTALEKAGLPIKPAYTTAEIRHLFHITDQTLEEWREHGQLRLTRIGRQVCVLYADLLSPFHHQ